MVLRISIAPVGYWNAQIKSSAPCQRYPFLLKNEAMALLPPYTEDIYNTLLDKVNMYKEMLLRQAAVTSELASPSGNRLGSKPFLTYFANVRKILLQSVKRPVGRCRIGAAYVDGCQSRRFSPYAASWKASGNQCILVIVVYSSLRTFCITSSSFSAESIVNGIESAQI